jgi:hypothetical protein
MLLFGKKGFRTKFDAPSFCALIAWLLSIPFGWRLIRKIDWKGRLSIDLVEIKWAKTNLDTKSAFNGATFFVEWRNVEWQNSNDKFQNV